MDVLDLYVKAGYLSIYSIFMLGLLFIKSLFNKTFIFYFIIFHFFFFLKESISKSVLILGLILRRLVRRDITNKKLHIFFCISRVFPATYLINFLNLSFTI